MKRLGPSILFVASLSLGQARSASSSRQALEVTFNQATAAMQAGNYPEAEAKFRSVLAADPRNLPALGNLAVVYSRTHRAAEAIALDQRALTLNPGNESLLLNIGLAYMKEEQYTKAMPIFRQLAATPDADHRFAILLATCLTLGDAPREGLDLIQAQKLNRADPSVAYLEAVAYARLNQSDAAEAIYKSLLENSATHTQASFLLGQALHEGHQLPEAESAFQDALRDDPNLVGAHRELGKVYISMQRFPDAERELRMAVTQDPKDGSALYFLGAMLVQSARPSEGVPFLSRAQALMPDSWSVPFYLGKAQYKQGHAPEAVPLLQQAASMNAEEPQVFYLLAEALRTSGHPEQAKLAMARVQELHSSALEAERQALSKQIAGAR